MSPQTGHMQVTIVCAKGLRDTAVFGVQDPFVVVHYGNLKFKTRKHRGGGTAPIWQETLTLPTQHGSPSKISLEIKNAGVLKADKVGTAEVSLDRAFNAGSDEVDAPVHTKDGRQQGEIQIALKFAPGDESSAVASTSAPAFPHSHSAPSALGDTHGQAVVEPSRAHKQSLEQDQGCAGPLGAGIAALSSGAGSVSERQGYMRCPSSGSEPSHSFSQQGGPSLQSPGSEATAAHAKQHQQHPRRMSNGSDQPAPHDFHPQHSQHSPQQMPSPTGLPSGSFTTMQQEYGQPPSAYSPHKMHSPLRGPDPSFAQQRPQSYGNTPSPRPMSGQQRLGSHGAPSSAHSSPQKGQGPPSSANSPFAHAAAQPGSTNRQSAAGTPNGSFSGGPNPQLWQPLGMGSGGSFSRSGASFSGNGSQPLDLTGRSGPSCSQLPSSFTTAPNYTLQGLFNRHSEPQGAHSSSSFTMHHPQQSAGSYSRTLSNGSFTSVRPNSAAAAAVALWPDKSRPSFTGRPSPVKQSPRSMVEAVHATPSAPPMSALDAAYSAPSALPSQHGQADQQDMHRSSSQYAALHVTAAEPHADAAQADAHRHNAAIHGGSQVPQEGLPHKLLSSAPETAFVHAHASGISHYALDSTASV